MKLTVEHSQFFCKICKEEVVFNINDDKSYLSKSIHESFFGMELSTYRVKHQKDNEYHINSVIMDHKGLFRGHLDAYIEQVEEQKSASKVLNVQQVGDEIISVDIFSLFYVVNYENMQAMVFENIDALDSIKFIETVQSRVEEASKIYVDKRGFTFTIADLEVEVLLFNGYILIYALQNPKHAAALGEIIDQYITISLDNLRHDSFLRGIRLLCHVMVQIHGTDQVSSLLALIANPLIFSIIDVKYPDKLPRIVRRLAQDFELSEEMLIRLFSGDMAINQILLETPEYYLKIADMIEYINRRKLLD